MFIAFFFILLGVVFLLRNLGILSGDVWGILWPLILISIGLAMLLKIHYWKTFWGRVWKKLEN